MVRKRNFPTAVWTMTIADFVMYMRCFSLYACAVEARRNAEICMDGIPIVGELRLDGVGAVFIADPLLTKDEREKIKAEADAAGVELHDYTGYFSNLGGRLSLTELLAITSSPLSVVIDDEKVDYRSGEEALSAITERYEVKDLSGEQIVLSLNHQKKKSTQEALAQAYAAVMGEET